MSIMREIGDGGGGVPAGGIGSVMGGAGAEIGAKTAVDSIGASFDNFTSQAAAGNIAVDAQGGQALLAFASEVQQWYQDNFWDVGQAAAAPKLGGSAAAMVVSPYMRQVGMDDDGYLAMMQHLAQRMEQFKAAVTKAMQTYQNNEHGTAHSLTKPGA